MKGTQKLVLLLISVVFFSASALPEQPQGPLRKWAGPFPGILPSPALHDPELRECWNRLRRPPGCMASIYESAVRGEVWLSKECCDAVKGLSDRCFQKIFAEIFFPMDFSQKIDGYCACNHGDSPASAPAL